MTQNPLSYRPITQLAPLIAAGKLKPTELMEACIARIDREDRRLAAFITRTDDLARKQAGERDLEAARGKIRGPLHGIPLVLKDVFDLAGYPTTAASGIFRNRMPEESAECVRRLIQAGAVILGKTNLQEFCRGPTGANSWYSPARNPWNHKHTPGGSSSGSAAAVAAGMAVASLGTDTGGSVRLPAAYCNLVGLRSTYGRVSRRGVIPLGRSFDNLGPITRTVEDAALLLQIMAGPDGADPTTGEKSPPDFRAALGRGLQGLSLGVPANYFWPGYEKELEEIVRGAIENFEKLGARIVELKIPWAELSQTAYSAVVGPESAEYHRPILEAHREDYVSPGADFFEESLFIPGWRYLQAQRLRTRFIRQAAEVFRQVDAILCPTAPISPPSIEACLEGMRVWGPISEATVVFSAIGNPVLQIPCGFTGSGFPVGLQIAGAWGDEAGILGIGAAYEAAHPLWNVLPPDWDGELPGEAGPALLSEARTRRDDPPGPYSPEDMEKAAAAMGYPLQKKRGPSLARGVNRLLKNLAAMDGQDLSGCEPANTLDLLQFPVRGNSLQD